MACLLAKDSYRTKEHARQMDHKLRIMRHNGEQILAFFDCPVTANTHAEIVDGGARQPCYKCVSFAEIVPVSEVKSFLEIDAVDGIKLRGYGVRFPYAARRDDVSSRTDILFSVREVIIGSKIGLTILFVFSKTYVLMRIFITNDLQKTATLYRLCRQRLANRREFFHTFEMSCNPKDHRAV